MDVDPDENKTVPARVNVLDDLFWSAPMQGIGIGNEYLSFKRYEEAEFVGDGVYTIFDSASSDI